jgi:peptidylglycine monooxygenase
VPQEQLIVALGPTRYRVERPWGDLPSGLGLPSDVTCTADGTVFVLLRTDRYTGDAGPAVIVLAPDGRRLGAWGEAVMDGHMLAAHPDGRLFVVDRDAHEITVFDRGGRRLGGLGNRHRPGEPFNAPCDVAFGPDGSIYVADGYGASLVHRFSAEGTPLARWGEPGDGPGQFLTPHGVWVMADGRVAVADRENDRVQVFDGAGRWLAASDGHYRAMSVHGAPGGGLYVTDQVPRLTLLDAAGRIAGRCRPVLNGAHGMWAAADGSILLAEMNPPRLTRLVPLSD